MSFSLLSRRLIGRAAATPAVPSLFRVPLTRFGSHHAPAGANAGLYDGFDIHPPKKRLVIEAKVWGAIAWFWIFYQLHNNWDVMLGYRHAFEHKGEHPSMDDDELPDGTSASGSHGHH